MVHIIFVFLFTLLLQADIALASCCASSSAASVGRLSKHERASVSMQSVFQTTMGHFSEQARHQFGAKPHRPHFALLNSIELMARLLPWLEPVALIPAEITWNWQNTNASFSDIGAGARIGVVSYEYLNRWPTLALVLMAKNGAGVWWGSPSLIIEKSIHDIVFGLNYGLEIPFRPALKDALWPGLKNNLSFGISGPLGPNWMLSLSNLWTWQQETRINNEILFSTDKRKTNLSAALTWSIHSHVKVKSHVGIDLPVHYIGKNLPTNFSLGFAIRMGVY